MALRNPGVTGFPAFGPRIDRRIIYHPRLHGMEAPLDLPTSSPASPNLSFTIGEGDLYTLDPAGGLIPTQSSTDAFSTRYFVYVLLCYRNQNASSRNLQSYYRSTGTSYTACGYAAIGAGKYKTQLISMGNYFAGAVGGTVDLKLEANGADVSVIWAYLIIAPYYLLGSPGDSVTDIGKSFLDISCDISTASWIGGTATRDGLLRHYMHGATHSAAGSDITPNTLTNWNVAAWRSIWNGGCIVAAIPTDAQSTKWSADLASDSKAHGQVPYPTRIAYTPLL